MANIEFKKVTKAFDGGKVTVIPDLSFEINDKEFIVLVGPSGCGKSTTLRMIAGLEEISGGELFINGKCVNGIEPKDRNIAMVFQSYALYPHMSVYKNMAFALKLKKLPKKEIDEKIRWAAKILDLESLLERKPRALSGGQRQRVALGRAMVRNPEVFLLDEPLSNLDAKLRTEMRSQIILLHKKLETTFVYVTHDQTEALTMADRIIVMDKGVIQQFDTPEKLYNEPANMFVAGFIGSPQMNFIDAALITESDGLYTVFYGNKIKIPSPKAEKLAAYSGKKVILGIRPENFSLTDDSKNAITVTPDFSEMTGSETNLHFKLGDENCIARIKTGTAVNSSLLTLKPNVEKLHFFDPETSKSITS